MWRAAGWKEYNAKVWIMPAPVAMAVAQLMEWIFWIGTFGSRRPGLLGAQQTEYACFSHTYSISKAREVLGYSPVLDFESGLKKSVEWASKHQGWDRRLHKK